eukprot:1156437-Pelagomonas_calceolata.AAC.17
MQQGHSMYMPGTPSAAHVCSWSHVFNCTRRRFHQSATTAKQLWDMHRAKGEANDCAVQITMYAASLSHNLCAWPG